MNEGDMLELVLEPGNSFDNRAIALHFNQRKIGYIPREDNDILSRLMDAEIVPLMAEITHLNTAAKAWENVHVALYVLKETTGNLPGAAVHLTQLETPYYRTVKLTGDKVARVHLDAAGDEEMMDAISFYDTMVANAKDDRVYNILHSDFESGQHLQEIIEEGRMVVNRNRLPEDLKDDSLVRVLSGSCIALDGLFDENGYLVANVNRVAGLSGRIDKIVGAFDGCGRLFYEVQFI